MNERYVSDSIMAADRLATKVARVSAGMELTTYEWRHGDITEGISNHQQLNCTMFNSLFSLKQKTSMLHITGPLCGESTSDGWIPLTKGQ